MSRLLLSGIVYSFFCMQASAALTPGTWTSVEATKALGSVGDVVITATTNAEAVFTDTATHRFTNNNVLCGGWDVAGFELELPESALALTTTYVNGGDTQRFDFDAPWAGGYFYIENFDSSSLAKITVNGGKIELVAASASITYEASSLSMGMLASSNAGYDGEGDAVFSIMGDVTSIEVAYEQGEGANGIFYGFAEGTPAVAPIPEPGSLLVWAGLIALVGGVIAKRRR